MMAVADLQSAQFELPLRRHNVKAMSRQRLLHEATLDGGHKSPTAPVARRLRRVRQHRRGSEFVGWWLVAVGVVVWRDSCGLNDRWSL